jgi:Arc/MetJ-type ribon-helix-helix transcriptional regulator
VKLSVSLDTDDVEFIDQYATEHAVGSRSAVMQKAVALLRAVELGDDYAAAWAEWSQADDADLWDAAVNDGLDK